VCFNYRYRVSGFALQLPVSSAFFACSFTLIIYLLSDDIQIPNKFQMQWSRNSKSVGLEVERSTPVGSASFNNLRKVVHTPSQAV